MVLPAPLPFVGQDENISGGNFSLLLYFDSPLDSPGGASEIDASQFVIRDDANDVMPILSAAYDLNDLFTVTHFLALFFTVAPSGIGDPPATIEYTPSGSSAGPQLVGVNGLVTGHFLFAGINGPP